MSGKVWMSSLFSNSNVGNKLGLRRQSFGSGWDPEGHAPPPVGQTVVKSIMRYTRGERLSRNEMPRAAAVWDEKCFARAYDIFSVGGVYCVKGSLYDVLANVDLGGGELIPFPIYKADLKTRYPGKFYLLNFGSQKDTILPERSPKLSNFVVEKETGKQYWKVDDWVDDFVTMSADSLKGPDLWVEAVLYNKIFLSDMLAQAIDDIGLSDVFQLEECRIAEDAQ